VRASLGSRASRRSDERVRAALPSRQITAW
jgi:hypothetical protein